MDNVICAAFRRKRGTSMNYTPEQIKAVKAQGFLFNNDKEHFNGRVITENGVLNAAQLSAIAEAAKKFGNGEVSFTTRMTVEVHGLHYEDIEAFQAELAKAGLVTGGTGAKVRPVVACKGTMCVFGLIDTQGLAKEIHKRFYEGYRSVSLPHKFKIAVGGCPNNCAKPDLNDIGIIGQRIPHINKETCRGCKKCACEAECPIGACHVVDGKLVIDEEKCNHCGRCITKCYFGANEGSQSFYKIYIGGRWGKQVRQGQALKHLCATKEEAMGMVEKAILLFKSQGKKGERFSSLVERLGMDKVEEILLSDDLLQRKEEILAE